MLSSGFFVLFARRFVFLQNFSREFVRYATIKHTGKELRITFSSSPPSSFLPSSELIYRTHNAFSTTVRRPLSPVPSLRPRYALILTNASIISATQKPSPFYTFLAILVTPIFLLALAAYVITTVETWSRYPKVCSPSPRPR